MIYSASKITSYYLYGKDITPGLVDDSLIRPSDYILDIPMARADYMSDAGQFAVGAQFDLVKKFFDPSTILAAGTYTVTGSVGTYNIFNALGISGTANINASRTVSISQAAYKLSGETDAQYAERVYVYGSTAFRIRGINDSYSSEAPVFTVDSDGTRHISNLNVAPLNDNFDFSSNNFIIQTGDLFLEPFVDPSGIGRKVTFDFTGNVSSVNYDQTKYLNDVNNISTWRSNSPTLAGELADISALAGSLFQNGTTKFLDSSSRPILYGKLGDDNLSAEQLYETQHLGDYETPQ